MTESAYKGAVSARKILRPRATFSYGLKNSASASVNPPSGPNTTATLAALCALRTSLIERPVRLLSSYANKTSTEPKDEVHKLLTNQESSEPQMQNWKTEIGRAHV